MTNLSISDEKVLEILGEIREANQKEVDRLDNVLTNTHWGEKDEMVRAERTKIKERFEDKVESLDRAIEIVNLQLNKKQKVSMDINIDQLSFNIIQACLAKKINEEVKNNKGVITAFDIFNVVKNFTLEDVNVISKQIIDEWETAGKIKIKENDDGQNTQGQ